MLANAQPRPRRLALAGLAVLAALTLASCRPPVFTWPEKGGPANPRPGAGDIRHVDVENATFPTSVCREDLRLPGDTFTLRDRYAGAFPYGDERDPNATYGVELKAVTYGDVDGDGRDDLAATFMCGAKQSDVLNDSVAVMGLRHGRLVPLAILLSSGVPAVAANGSPLEYEFAEGVSIQDGRLVVHWFQTTLGGDELGAGYDVTVTYRISGGQATIVAQTDRQVRPRG